MCVRIKQINDRVFSVNGKPIYLDVNDNWVANGAMTPKEEEAARKHIETINSPKTNEGTRN